MARHTTTYWRKGIGSRQTIWNRRTARYNWTGKTRKMERMVEKAKRNTRKDNTIRYMEVISRMMRSMVPKGRWE